MLIKLSVTYSKTSFITFAIHPSVLKGNAGGFGIICAPISIVPTPIVALTIPAMTPFEFPCLTNIPKVNIPIIVPDVIPPKLTAK